MWKIFYQIMSQVGDYLNVTREENMKVVYGSLVGTRQNLNLTFNNIFIVYYGI